MPNQTENPRVLVRLGARELRPEELDQVNASGPPCRLTFTHLPGGGSDEDTQCP
jgi:hypothetical protein